MRQQINFLKSIPKPELQLPAQWIILSLISALFLVTFISIGLIIGQIRSYVLLKEAHEANNQVASAFQQTAREHPLLASDMPLAMQIAVYEKELDEKKKNFDILTGSSLRYGFSNYLETLAQVVPDGLWLSTIMINQEHKLVTIKGYMVKPANMSSLLQALQETPTFAKTIFNVFYIKNVTGKSYTEFSLTNDPSTK